MSSSASVSSTGSNAAPISFPGIASGIDYTSIINKLTSLTLEPTNALNAQLATLNSANTELIKIGNLFNGVQSALGELSDPSLFQSYDALSSNTSAATATGLPSVVASPGTYTIESDSVATATSITSNAAAGHSINDNITSGPYAGTPSNQVPLASSYAAITPSNGSGSAGTITVDGVTVSYNVNVDSLNAILSRIQTAVQTNYDSSFTISDVGGTIQVSGSKPITLGSSTDQGNLLQVLKLDQAQVNDSGAGPYSVSGTSNVGGINLAQSFDDNNAAGFTTPVTSGTFSINGVSIAISASGDNLNSIITKINASGAGVLASYNSTTNQITLTSTATGPKSIVLGGYSDTSNFLSAAGLTSSSGATTAIGQQAVVKVANPNGSTSTIYSNSNDVTNAIPGVSLNLISNQSTAYTITVSQNTSNLVSAVNNFVSAYNAAVQEIAAATQPPVVTAQQPGSNAPASAPIGGGVLWGNASIQTLQGQLTQLVSGFFGSGQGYNSLASIGLNLSDSFTVLTTANNGQTNGGTTSGSSSDPVQQTTYQGTDGTLLPLNSSTLLAALAANPTAVQNVFQGASSLTTQLGSFLTGVTGLPTLLNTGTVGTIPSTSMLQGFENSNNDEITSVQAQIKQITDNATMQANQLRQEFVASETTIAGLQAEQSQLSGFFKSGS